MASYNFKILARELNRFNKKKIEELTKKIGEKEDELFDLYLKGEKQKLLMMIKEAS
jgi:RNA binding exosome subunit